MSSPRAAINSANASRQGRASFWTAERETALRNLWGAGEFAADIAAALGDRCTRLRVVGKAHRLKLSARKGWNRFGQSRHRPVIRVQRETREGAAA